MARNFQTNLILGGDPRGGLNALRQVRGKMQQTQRQTGRMRVGFRDLNRQSMGLNSTLLRLGGILGVSLSFGAAIRGVQSLASDGSGMGHLAARTDFAVERLQEYRFAAEQSDVASSQFDDAIQRLNRRLGLFVETGGGAASDAIQRLGIETRDAAGRVRATDEVFLDIVDRIGEFDSVSQQAAVASEFFGDRAGPRLVGMLSLGREGLEELAQQARDTGSIMSQEAVDASQRYEDSMNRVRLQTRGLAVQLFDGLIPGLEGTVQQLIRAREESNGLQTAGERLAIGLNVLVRSGVIVSATFQAAGTAVAGLAALVVSGFQQIIGAASATINSLALTADALAERRWSDAADAIRGVGGAISATTREARILGNEGIDAFRRDIPGIFRTMDERLEKVQSGLNGTGAEGAKAGRDIAEAFGELSDDNGPLSEAADQSDKFLESLENQIDNLREQELRLRGGTRAVMSYRLAQMAAAGATREQITEARALIEELIDTEGRLEATRVAMDANAEATKRMADEAARLAGMGVLGMTGMDFLGVSDEQSGGILGEGDGSLSERLSDAVGDGLADGFDQFVNNLSDRDFDAILGGNFGDVGRRLGVQMTQAVGNELGSAIGDMAGEQLGEGIAANIVGGLAGAAGGILGGILGNALFGEKDPKFQLGGDTGFAGTGGTARGAEGTIFGDTLFRFRNIEDEASAELLNALQQFDTQLAAAIGGENMDAAAEALRGFEFDSADDGASFRDVAEARFAVVLETFDEFTQGLVARGRTLEDQIQRLADLRTIDREIGFAGGLGLTGGALDSIDAPAAPGGGGDGPAGDGPSGPLGISALIRSVAESSKESSAAIAEVGEASDETNPALQATALLVEELMRPTETLGETFERLRESMASLDTASALTGRQLADSRVEAIRFADGLAAAFGDDLDRMSGAFDRVFATFFSGAERAEVRVEQSTDRATDLLASIGVDATDEILSQGGFRELFDSLYGQIGPEETAILLEAGVAVSDLIDAERDLAEARGDASAQMQQQQADLMAEIGEDIAELQLSPLRLELAGFDDQLEATRQAAAGMAREEDILALARERHTLQVQALTGQLEASITSLTEDLFGDNEAAQATQRITGGVESAANDMRDAIIRGLQSVRDWLDDSLLDNLSTLTPEERLGEAQSQFQSAIAAVQSGDLSAVGDLPGLADAFRGEAAGFFGTSTNAFADIEAQVREAMQAVADIDDPAQQAPTAAQAGQIEANTSATAASARDQASRAAQLVDELGLLSRITDEAPADIAERFGIPMDELMTMLGLEVPDANAAALRPMFDELVTETDLQLDAMMRVEDLLTQIRDRLPGAGQRFDEEFTPFATGGVVTRPTRGLVGEAGPEAIIPLDRFFGDVMPGADQSREIRALKDEVRRLNELVAEGNAQRGQGNSDRVAGVQVMRREEQETRRKLDRRTSKRGAPA